MRIAFGIIIKVFTMLINGVVSIFNSIINAINGYRINKNNQISRGITEYQPSQIEGFFRSDEPAENAVISGGTNRIRSQTINAIIYAACTNNLPVVVLHEANNELETMLQMSLANTNRLILINQSNQIYDPFVGLSDNEISKLIMDAAPKDFDIKPNAKSYIDGMLTYIHAINKVPSLNVFAKCPHSDLFTRVDGLIANNKITDVKGQEIKSRLMSGQSECYKLESYFSSLDDQIDSILSRKSTQSQQSITKVIDDNKVIVIDITSNVNKLLINVLITQIKNAIGKGKYVSFVADELSTENSELFSNLIRMHSDKCKMTISSRDLFAMCSGDEKTFNTIIGNSQRIAIYAHSSGASATKWAEAVGYYDKTEKSTSYSSSSSRSTPYNIFSFDNYSKTSGSTDTVNYNMKREYIIKPEEINRMLPNEVYVIDSFKKEIAHTKLV